ERQDVSQAVPPQLPSTNNAAPVAPGVVVGVPGSQNVGVEQEVLSTGPNVPVPPDSISNGVVQQGGNVQTNVGTTPEAEVTPVEGPVEEELQGPRRRPTS
ncbi:hypothetical protein HK102_007933, partial [Quaeritorhiza haematococci]